MNQLLLRGFKPDPSICKAGNDYFMVTSSFEFFPSIPIFHSTDLVSWEQIGYCLDRASQVNLEKIGNSQGMFAPTIRYHEGVFYMVCTNVGGGGNFLVTTEDPFKGWSEPLYLPEWTGIDPSLYFEGDKAYIHGTRDWATSETAGIYLSEIDLKTGRLITERKNVWPGTGATDPEGPHLYKKDDWYYLLISEGGTEFGHMLTTARSKHIYGPYESYENNPILTNRSLENPIQAVGHGDLVEHEGQWVMVFLAFRCIRYPRQHNLGRETFICPVDWNEAAWPTIGDSNKFQLYASEKEMLADRVDYEFKDDFNEEKLNPFWQYLRVPITENYQLKNNQLHLKAEKGNLNNSFGVSFLGTSQTEYDFYAETSLDLKESLPVEAGLTVYVRDDFHYDLFVKIENNQKRLVMRRVIGNIQQIEELNPISTDNLRLFVKGEPDSYFFGYINEAGQEELLFEGQTRLLATEVTGGFTGTTIGIYATSVKDAMIGAAKFNYFKYQTKK